MKIISKKLFGIESLFFWIALLQIAYRPSASAQNQWTADGKFAANSIGSNVHMSAITDEFGGAFIAFENYKTGDADIYVNRMDASGASRWGVNGYAAVSSALNQKYPSVTTDGISGFFVAWQDEFTTDIYAQRYNDEGTALWSAGGIVVCSAADEQSMVKAESDGAGGLILVWQDKRNYSTSGIDLYAQHLNGSGVPQWASNGVAVCMAPGNQSSQVVVSDKNSGVIVVWHDTRNGTGNYDIYAQRLNAGGSPQFGTNGIAVCTASSNQMNPSLTASGPNQWITAWDDNRNSSSSIDIYAQAFNGTGGVLWAANGVSVCTASYAQTTSRLTDDSQNGAIVVWQDARSGTVYDIYAQRLNGSGNALWASDGIPVNQAANNQYAPETVSDGSGGVIVVWNDYRTGSNVDMYAQRINSGGSLQWTANGLPIVVQPGSQQYQVMVSDGSGGAIALWQDGRVTGKSDVYAQLVNDAVAVTNPTAGILWNGTQVKTIQWTNRVSVNKIHHYTIKASAAPGDGFPITVAASVAASSVSQTWTPSPLNSASVQIKIQAINSEGELMNETLSPIFTVDSTPPLAFDLVSPASGSVTTLKPTFQWQATTDALSTLDHYELWIDGALVQSVPSATSYTLTDVQKLTSAQHTWTVKALDKAGLVRQANQSWPLTASDDTTPPNPFHLLSPADNAWTAQTNPPFSWESTTDVGKGMAKFQLYVDDVLALDNIPPAVTSANSVTLTAGPHTWFVKAVDLANNVTQSLEKWTVKVDNVQPAAFDLNAPANNAWTNDATPTFSWQASSDAGSCLLEYKLLVDGQVKVDHIPPASPSATPPDGAALTEGTHTWSVVARDAIGNVRSSASTFTIGVDVTAPQAPVLSAPANAVWVIQPSPVFSWQAASDARSGLKEYQLFIDGSPNRLGLTSTSATPSSPLAEGTHSWSVKAFDNAGNSANSSMFNFTGDFTPPTSFALVSPANGSTIHTTKPKYTWRSSSDARSGFQKFEFYVDGALKNGYLGATDTSLTLTNNLEIGQHRWKVVAWDNAGNNRDSGEAVFTVQISPPQITSPSTASAKEHELFSYTITATDADGDPLTYGFEGYPSWLVPSGSTISGIPPEGTPSNCSFKVKVSDGVFDPVQMTVQLTVQLVNDPPERVSPISAVAIEHEAFSYTAVANDPENDPVTYTFQNYPNWMTPSGNKITGTTPKGATNTSFKVVASDGQNNILWTVSVLVNVVNDPPVFNSSNTASATEHQLFTYTAVAVDPDGGGVTYTFSGYPAWLTPSGNTISGTPQEGDNSTTFVVTASDGQLSTPMTVNLTVIEVNDPPVFSSSNTASATEHQPFSYTAIATDPEGGQVTFVFSNYPPWLTPSSNKISGTPQEGDHSTTFVVTASDGQISTPMTVNLTVTPVNDPPVFSSSNSASATEHQPFSYTAVAADPEGVQVTYTFSNYPAWLTPSGNTISGTPQEGDHSTTFVVTASDGQLSTPRTVNLTVTPVNDPPVFSSLNAASATEHQLFSYTAVATDPEGGQVTYAFSNYPPWLTPSGNTISGTPQEGDHSTTFVVTASDGLISTPMTVTLAVTPVNDPPVFNSANAASAMEHQLFTYTAVAVDPEGVQVTYTFTGYPAWLTPSCDKISGTPQEGDHSTTFVVTASDGQLSTPRTVNLTVTPVNDPPEITSPDSVVAKEDVPFSYTATATDPENDLIHIAYVNFPKWMSVSGNTIQGSLPETGRDTTFTVIADDGKLSDTLKVFVGAETVNDPPKITSSSQAFATEKQPFSYVATFTDPDGPRNSIRFVEYPSWLSPSGPVLSGTPDNVPESESFKVIVSDGQYSDTLAVSLHVSQVNDPPKFIYAFPNPTFDGSSVQWSLNLDDYAMDPDDPDSSLTWSCQLLDSVRIGVTIHPKTHISTMWGTQVERSFRVAFTVSDPHNASAADTVYVNIAGSGAGVRRIAEAPREFSMDNNYPNPFNPATTIRYGLPKPCQVNLKIYNIQGREVASLFEGKQQAGVFEVKWDASTNASGIYFYVIRTDSWKKVMRMMLVK